MCWERRERVYMWENKKHSIRGGEGHLNHGWEVPGKCATGKRSSEHLFCSFHWNNFCTQWALPHPQESLIQLHESQNNCHDDHLCTTIIISTYLVSSIFRDSFFSAPISNSPRYISSTCRSNNQYQYQISISWISYNIMLLYQHMQIQ